MLGELGIVADDDVAALHILGVELSPVGRQDELRLGPGGLWTRLECGQRSRGLTLRGDLDVDVAPLEDPTDIGSIRSACAEPLDGCLLVPNASRKVKGNSPGSNGSPAREETASSISTAFIGRSRFFLAIVGGHPNHQR